jgi:hypothetical protein
MNFAQRKVTEFRPPKILKMVKTVSRTAEEKQILHWMSLLFLSSYFRC